MREVRDLVSIILPTYNDEKTVRSTLESLIRLAYDQKEILIVDDGSTDNTPAIVSEYRNHEGVQVIQTTHHGRSHTRNLGFKNARGSLVFFAESDAIYDPNYLTRTTAHFEDPQVGGVLPIGDVLTPESLVEKCLDIEMRIRNAKALANRLKPISAWVYRADVFRQAGGFDERLEVAEDQDLATRVRRLGYDIVYEPSINWWHPAQRSVLDLVKRSARHGRSRIPYCLKYPRKIPFVYLGILSLFTLFLLLSPISSIFPLSALLLLGVVVLTEAIQTLRDGWSVTEDRKYLVILPLLGVVRSLSFTIGFIVGLALFLFSRR